MPSPFPFPLIKGSFEALLGHDWPESADKGWLRSPQAKISDQERNFAALANRYFGCNFSYGESPTLGKTLIVNPASSLADQAFADAYGQVAANHHSAEKAASGLALHGYMQNLYHNAGVLDKWGHWSLGCNTGGFNVYKMDPQSPNENTFLRAAQRIIQASHRVGQSMTADMRIYSAQPTQVAQLKIHDRPTTPDVLSAVHDKLVASLELCAKAGPQDQAILQRRLGL